MPGSLPSIIAHRGASGVRPEHTLSAYQLALDMGADAIELDLVPTRDGSLIARHDNELSITTDVADHPEFASRRRTKILDGIALTGWFSEDFTIDEIRALRARQRFDFRSREFDGLFPVPALEDLLQLAQIRAAPDRPIRIYIELKHAAHFASIGLPFEQTLLPIIDAAMKGSAFQRGTGVPPVLLSQTHGRNARATTNAPQDEICIESFDPDILRLLRGRTSALICQLIDDPVQAAQFRDMLLPAGLARIKEYADGIGVWKRLIVPTIQTDADGVDASRSRLGSPTSLIDDAHRAGLFVDAWSFRDEPRFLAADYGGDPAAEYRQFFALGVDGMITDFPETALSVIRGAH